MTVKGMTFLEAKRVASASAAGTPLPMFLAMSGAAEPLLIFLRAAAAMAGYAADVAFPPFGTLRQAMLSEPSAERTELFLLCPWDLVPEADWRTGVPPSAVDPDAAIAAARDVLNTVARRSPAVIVYVDAPLPPLGLNPGAAARVRAALAGLAASAGADVLDGDCFSLSDYLAHGCPFGGQALGNVAAKLVDGLLGGAAAPRKVLVTDLDNTLWSGVVAEDGPDGIHHGAQGKGYRHFIYQTYLKRLERDGVLLAAVTRNDPETVDAVLASGGMALGKQDFVGVIASYHAKSAQIRTLAESLNLGLDAFVFVDDNDVELEEVTRTLPDVKSLRFAASEKALPGFLDELAALFARNEVTEEDRQRTRLYRQRLDAIVPSDAEGADLTDFLSSLEMRLTITERTTGDRTRAVQLINKTNQFNLNGRRWTDDEIGAVLAAGGRLVCASLADRTGDHGEVVACLLDAEGTAECWVMSCRVFQRRVEHAFLLSLLDAGIAVRRLRFVETPRNEPLRAFLSDPAFTPAGAAVELDADGFRRAHGADLDLFEVSI